MNTQQFVANAVRTMRILWGALTASTVLLAFVALRMVPAPPSTAPGANLVVIAVVALGAAVASFLLPANLYRTAARRRRPPLAEPEPGPGGPRGPARFTEHDVATRMAFATYMTPFILSMALSESVSLDGVIEHVFRAPDALTYGLFAAGTLLAAVRYPRPARILAAFERAHGASFPAAGGRPY